ncbi:Bifunctional purine biosynthesis protein PurH [Polystyrenella longa]|uniref:Bifunctional purine biosynthesis protein PurH n=1 Tax=Polystyrenella longa TaxID=2528007 RepID=A0A518CHS3_9PLAN|nr:bifunctional phosphoribosylaminoimidazolecarboxamide formyltransferase/IMP cyclohydrolase [Polystyrenella longa]QDU78776.1 Bifunctional purine biosynthesis protein PurH [Polystyrenella longa]
MAAPRALISVSDKTGVIDFARELHELGYEILSTGGTFKSISEAGIPVIEIATYTEFPEIMNGRVKTLHPRVHGAILGRPDLPADQEAMQQHGIVPFQIVACNLYPFQQTVAKPDVTLAEAIEQIDIGGPSMIRSSAKNHKYVAVVTKSEQYPQVIEKLKGGGLDETFRRQLATAAFKMTFEYDRGINAYLNQVDAAQESGDALLPEQLSLEFSKELPLRYGENPHQQAAFYVEANPAPSSVAAAKQLNGKELSYNNLLDLDAAMAIVQGFERPAVSIIKHNNPCGCGTAGDLAVAFERAYSGDPISAFGSIVGLNRPVDLATAEQMCGPDKFIEAVIAPSYNDDAFELLTTKPKWKANVRLMTCPALNDATGAELDYRRVSGGLLVQERDLGADPRELWKVVTDREPTEQEWLDLAFGWNVCRHVKSNAIVYVKGESIVGVGAGQMSRLDSAFIAAHKAGERSQGGIVASDAFFPFRDGIDQAAGAGIKAAIQPGGSRRDDEVIAACNEHGIAMVFTERRHFKH